MTDEVRLDQIPAETVDQAWFWVEELVNKVVAVSEGELNADRLREAAKDGKLALWVASDPADTTRPLAVALTRLEDWSGEAILRIVCVAGTSRNRWVHLIRRLEELARLHGASRIRWEGRKGWARLLPDYDITRIVLEKRLS